MKGILLPDSLPKPGPRAPRMTPPAGQPRTGTQRVRRDEIAHAAHTRAGLPLGKGREPALAVAGREEGEALESQANRWHDGWSVGELMMIVFIVVFLVGAAFTFAVVFGLLDR